MDVNIVKNCEVRLQGTIRALQKWTRLNLPNDKAQKLIDAGFAEPTSATEEARQLSEYFGEKDPGGECWPWVQHNLPNVWRSHMKAILANDLSTSRSTFDTMISAWEVHHDQQQPDLLAA